MRQTKHSELIEKLLTKDCDRELIETLRGYGKQLEPALVSALQDPRFHAHHYKTYVMADSAFAVVLELLEEFASVKAIPALAKLPRVPADGNRRAQAAHILGRIAHKDCITSLTCAINDGDENVVASALDGIRIAAMSKRLSRSFARAMFKHIEPLLRNEAYDAGDPTVPDLLLVLDKKKSHCDSLGQRLLDGQRALAVHSGCILGTRRGSA